MVGKLFLCTCDRLVLSYNAWTIHTFPVAWSKLSKPSGLLACEKKAEIVGMRNHSFGINSFITIFFHLGKQTSSAFTSSKSFTNFHTNYYNYLRSKINPSAGALYALGSCPGPFPPQGRGAVNEAIYVPNDREWDWNPVTHDQCTSSYMILLFLDQLQTHRVSGFSTGVLFPVNITASCYSFSTTPTCWHCLNLRILDPSIEAGNSSIIIKYQS